MTRSAPATAFARVARSTALLVALALSGATVMAQTLPAGWRASPTATAASTSETRQFEAAGLPAGEFATVQQSAVAPLAGLSPASWLDQSVTDDPAPVGRWTGPAAAAQPQGNGIVTTSRAFTGAGGVGGMAIYFAVAGQAQTARRIRVAFSSPAIARGPQGAAARELVASLLREPLPALPAPARPATAAAPPRPATAAAPPRTGTTAATAPPTAFRFVTQPGAGLRADDVETVFYHWDQRYDAYQGLTLDEDAYLLLKDGSAYAGLPVPPQDFDAAASRRAEPQRWGRWRRAGDSYEFAWATSPDRFRAERGNPVPRQAAGAALDGRYAGAWSYALPGGGVTTWSERGLRLSADGRFEIDRSGGAAVSGGGGDASTTTVYDNERSASATVSATMAGGSQVTTGDGADRRGRYRVDGYGIELRYENGRVERRAFFVDGDGVWLFGTRLGPAK